MTTQQNGIMRGRTRASDILARTINDIKQIIHRDEILEDEKLDCGGGHTLDFSRKDFLRNELLQRAKRVYRLRHMTHEQALMNFNVEWEFDGHTLRIF